MTWIPHVVRRRPRTTVLVLAAAGGGLAGAWALGVSGETLWSFAPLAACLGMHALMHGDHGGHEARKTDETAEAE